MKVTAELKEITQEMASEELVDALNHNFKELKETSEQRDQVMLNSIGKIETLMTNLETRMINVEFNLNKIIDHLSGKKLLTEEEN